MAALNLDRLSEGRFFLGLGTSGAARGAGPPRRASFAKLLPPGCASTSTSCARRRGASALDHDGEFFKTRGSSLRFDALSRRTCPIYIASLSPAEPPPHGRAGRRLAPDLPGASRMAAAVAELASGAKAAGRSLADDRDRAPGVDLYVTDDVAAARDRERPHIASTSGAWACFYHQYMHRIGFGADADRVRHAFQATAIDRRHQARDRRDGRRDDDHRHCPAVPRPGCRPTSPPAARSGSCSTRPAATPTWPRCKRRRARGARAPVKFGVLQFFSWTWRVPLHTVYARAAAHRDHGSAPATTASGSPSTTSTPTACARRST